MPHSKKLKESGSIDVITIIGILFLLITLSVATYVATNKDSKLNIGSRAKAIIEGVDIRDPELQKSIKEVKQKQKERAENEDNQNNNQQVVDPTTPPKKTCDINGVPLSENSVVIGGTSSSGYSKCINGSWTPCPTCTITQLTYVPSYLQQEYQDAINLQNIAINLENQEMSISGTDVVQEAKKQEAKEICLMDGGTWNGSSCNYSTPQQLADEVQLLSEIRNGSVQTTMEVIKDEGEDGGFQRNLTTIVRNSNDDIIATDTTSVYIERDKSTIEKTDLGFIKENISILRNKETDDIIGLASQSIRSDKKSDGSSCSSDFDCGSGKCSLTKNFSGAPEYRCATNQTWQEKTYDIAQTLSLGTFGRYIDAYKPENTTQVWQKLKYNSVQECQNDQYTKNGRIAAQSCNTYQVTSEQVSSSVALGTILTVEGTLITATGGTLTGTYTIPQAFSLAMTTSTVYQTGTAVDICVTNPGSPECKNSAFWAGVSWFNIATSGVSNALQATKYANLANSVNVGANVINIGTDFLDINQSCGDGAYASDLSCAMAWGGLIVDSGQGVFDVARGLSNLADSKLSNLSGDLGLLPNANNIENIKTLEPDGKLTNNNVPNIRIERDLGSVETTVTINGKPFTTYSKGETNQLIEAMTGSRTPTEEYFNFRDNRTPDDIAFGESIQNGPYTDLPPIPVGVPSVDTVIRRTAEAQAKTHILIDNDTTIIQPVSPPTVRSPIYKQPIDLTKPIKTLAVNTISGLYEVIRKPQANFEVVPVNDTVGRIDGGGISPIFDPFVSRNSFEIIGSNKGKLKIKINGVNLGTNFKNLKPGDIVEITPNTTLKLSNNTSLKWDGNVDIPVFIATVKEKSNIFDFIFGSKTKNSIQLDGTETVFFHPGDKVTLSGGAEFYLPPKNVSGKQVYYKYEIDGKDLYLPFEDVNILPVNRGDNYFIDFVTIDENNVTRSLETIIDEGGNLKQIKDLGIRNSLEVNKGVNLNRTIEHIEPSIFKKLGDIINTGFNPLTQIKNWWNESFLNWRNWGFGNAPMKDIVAVTETRPLNNIAKSGPSIEVDKHILDAKLEINSNNEIFITYPDGSKQKIENGVYIYGKTYNVAIDPSGNVYVIQGTTPIKIANGSNLNNTVFDNDLAMEKTAQEIYYIHKDKGISTSEQIVFLIKNGYNPKEINENVMDILTLRLIEINNTPSLINNEPFINEVLTPLSEKLTGKKIGDPTLPNIINNDTETIRLKYHLPDTNLKVNDPEMYITKLIEYASDRNIIIMDLSEHPNPEFFAKEAPHAGAVAIYPKESKSGKWEIYYPQNNTQLSLKQKAETLAHELVHTQQDPNLPFENKEYEAYLIQHAGDTFDRLERQNSLFSEIYGSTKFAYEHNLNQQIPDFRINTLNQGQSLIEFSTVMPAIISIPTIGLYYLDQYLDLGIFDYIINSINETLDIDQTKNKLGAIIDSSPLSILDKDSESDTIIDVNFNLPEIFNIDSEIEPILDNTLTITPPEGLTKYGDGECTRSSANAYCDGTRMFELYEWYTKQTDAWWNEDGQITPAEFLALMLVSEATGGDPELLKAITIATANQIWGSSDKHEPYCKTPSCEEGIFNFLGDYVQSAGERYNGLISNDGNPSQGTIDNLLRGQEVAKYFESNGLSLEQIANDLIYNPISTTYGNDSPTQWGVTGCGENCEGIEIEWLKNLNSQSGVKYGTTDRCGIFDVYGQDGVTAVVFTNNQAYNWSLPKEESPCY